MRTVLSADGTPIAYAQSGKGPDLVLVHGTSTLRAAWASIFEEHFTVTAMERRGRGDSGDGARYALEREFEDVAAVVEAVGEEVLLFGHSFGGLCALGAAMLTHRLKGLVLYEPDFPDGSAFYTQEQFARLEALLAAGDPEGLLRAFHSEILGLPRDQIDMLEASPAWPDRIATAPTIARELHAAETRHPSVEVVASLQVPVLLLSGSESPPEFARGARKLAELLPTSRVVVMPGQQHIAMYTGPGLLVGAVLDFAREIGLRSAQAVAGSRESRYRAN